MQANSIGERLVVAGQQLGPEVTRLVRIDKVAFIRRQIHQRFDSQRTAFLYAMPDRAVSVVAVEPLVGGRAVQAF